MENGWQSRKVHTISDEWGYILGNLNTWIVHILIYTPEGNGMKNGGTMKQMERWRRGKGDREEVGGTEGVEGDGDQAGCRESTASGGTMT